MSARLPATSADSANQTATVPRGYSITGTVHSPSAAMTANAIQRCVGAPASNRIATSTSNRNASTTSE